MVTSGVGGCQDTPKMGELKPVIRLAISVNFMIGAYAAFMSGWNAALSQ